MMDVVSKYLRARKHHGVVQMGTWRTHTPAVANLIKQVESFHHTVLKRVFIQHLEKCQGSQVLAHDNHVPCLTPSPRSPDRTH